MKRLIASCVALLLGAAAYAGDFHVVRKGDTLSALFGARAGQVCQLNKLSNCNKIVVGQKLHVSNVAVRAEPASCMTLGAAPFNPEHKMSRLREGIELLTTLSPEQKALAQKKVAFEERERNRELVGRQVFKEMLYQSKTGKVVHVYDKPICTPEQGGQPEVMDTYDLGGGVFLAIPKRCGNVAVFMKPVPPQPKPIPVVVPPVVVPVPPIATPAPVPTPEPKEVPKADGAVYEHQVDAYVGYGKVWHGPSHYGYAGFDWYLKQWVFVDEDGKTHRLGFGADYSAGSGQAGTDGKFNWDALTLRPVAYKIEGKDGKTLRLRILVTRIRDGVVADQGRYQNERTMYQWGPEVIFTDQGRKDAGHKWWSEHRFSAAVLFAFHKSGSHSWEGTPITDTTELLKVKGMIRAGARLYIYDFDGGYRTFVQAGASVQWPNVARSVGISVGVEGPDELWTVFVGPNFDLKQHTWSFGAEVSLQVGKAYLLYRGKAAQAGIMSAVECVERDGFAYNPSTGVMTPGSCPKDAAAKPVLISASPQAEPWRQAVEPSGP